LFSSGAVGISGDNDVKARPGDKSDEDGHRELREHVGKFLATVDDWSVEL